MFCNTSLYDQLITVIDPKELSRLRDTQRKRTNRKARRVAPGADRLSVARNVLRWRESRGLA